MEKKPTVTIGLVAKNAQHTVGQAIESIMEQYFPHELMELIIVDGYSKDATFSIIQDYVSKIDIKSRIFREKEGLGKARQIIVENANGDYIVWVDADMILPKDHVRKQVAFMQTNPKVAIACARFYGLPDKDLLVVLQNLEWVAINYINKSKTNTSLAVCGGAIYRTEAIRQAGGFNTEIIGAGEDEELEWKVSSLGWEVRKGTDAHYFEKRKKGWKAIWNQFFWYGYGKHYLLHKKKTEVKPSKLLEGFVLSIIAYRLTGRKVAFLLPIQFYFKRIAWYFGFVKAHLKGYGHT
jgi:glycosyltransferase involved in cell wall biosynthesis